MDVIILENSTFDRVQSFICELTGQSLLNVLTRREFLSVKRVLLSSWSQLVEQTQTKNAGFLFELEGGEDFEVCLCDITDLAVNTQSLQLLKKVSQSGDYSSLVIYSSQSLNFGTDQKKEIKKYGLQVVDQKKPDNRLLHELSYAYSKEVGLPLEKEFLTKMADQCIFYQQVIDNIDYMVLSGNPELAYDSLQKEPIDELYKIPFIPGGLNYSLTKKWAKVGQDELQLALSLVYGKLEKQGKPARQTLRELINTDYKIKTISKIPALTWWKYFIFRQAA